MTKLKDVLAHISILSDGSEAGKNVSEIENEMSVYNGYFYDFLRKRVRKYVENGIIDAELLTTYQSLYNSCKYNKNQNKKDSKPIKENVVETAIPIPIPIPNVEPTEEPCDSTVQVCNVIHQNGVVRMNGKIVEYVATITVDNQEYECVLNREEMELIHRVYSSEGENQSQKQLLRQLSSHMLDRNSLKKLLTALNVTKASAPFPLHVFEENSLEDIIEMTNRLKERAYYNRLGAEQVKYLEKRNSELSAQINKLKSKHNIVSKFDVSKVEPYIPTKKFDSKLSMYIYISDCHVGAYVDNRSIYNNKYDKEEFNNRLGLVIDETVKASNSFGGFDKVVVVNLGDSLDGYDNKTTRGGHTMPQNMDNKEQFEVFTSGMIRLFDSLNILDVANSVDYICVGESNHDGDFGWAANAALETYLKAKYPTMHVQIFKKFLGVYHHGKHTFVFTHGKDNKDMFKNLPLTLNDKTEKFLLEYIDELTDVRENIHIIKGDLHQSATNYNRKFRYRNVGSLFGSSKWIHHNFGNTKACFDYDIIDSTSSYVLSGRKELN